MANILALDAATDTCSVALQVHGRIIHRCELIPRQHNQRLFSMLREVLENGSPTDRGVELLAYNHGPGSFTGLRIAASAVQGLAYSCGLPVVGVSTLACLAQGVWRKGLADPAAKILVILDARINEVYWGLYACKAGVAMSLLEDAVSEPGAIPANLVAEGESLVAAGSGLCYLEQLAPGLRSEITLQLPEQWPDSIDTLSLAERYAHRGKLLAADQVQPVYLRNEIQWKKISEQG
jgi:tRNA threonylcarbamoyladenosine biosynthesis protein TsaB